MRFHEHILCSSGSTYLHASATRSVEKQVHEIARHCLSLFPLAEKRLSEPDWKVIEIQLKQNRDPLFDAYDKQYEALRRYIETQQAPTP